ncbi:MAG: Rieske 2Fe-2S domain-containing protein [Bacteroidota bacterium]
MKIYLNQIKKNIELEGRSFIPVCKSKEVLEKKGLQLIFEDDLDFQIALFRLKGQIYCVSNICPHRHADQIFNGIISGMNITCPLHGWTYSLETGKNTNPHQGLRSLVHYDSFESEGLVYIEKPHFEPPAWRKNL